HQGVNGAARPQTLRSAINYYHKEYGPLPAVPVVTGPDAPPPRLDYWLARKQVADRIRIARKDPNLRHIARMLLIGVYTGSRPGAMLDLRWVPLRKVAGSILSLRRSTGRGSANAKPRSGNRRRASTRAYCRISSASARWTWIAASSTHFRGRAVEDVRKA